MVPFSSFLARFLPFSIKVSVVREEKIARVELDIATHKEGEWKVESVWSWKKFKNEKFAICFKGDKFIMRKVE